MKNFALGKEDTTKRDGYIDGLREAFSNVATAVDTFNDEMTSLREKVEEALTKYNEVLAEARSWVEDIAVQAETDIDEKSEKWQESDRGEAAVDFKSEWENVMLDDLEVEFPDVLSVDEPDHASDIEALPSELAV